MNRLFRDDIEPRDQTYRFVRDDTRGAEVKSFVERLWSFYAPYADGSFKADEDAIQRNNAQRRVK